MGRGASASTICSGGQTICIGTIWQRATDSPMVWRKKLKRDGEFVIGFASIFKFKGNEYLRRLKVSVRPNHPLASMNVFATLQGERIRRVETTEYKLWYSPTNKMFHNLPVYFYYELSEEPDKLFRGWRWKRGEEQEAYDFNEFVCIRDLKLNAS